MTYQRFKIVEIAPTPATLATTATLRPPEAQTVANVATVAGPKDKNNAPTARTVANVANVAGGSAKSELPRDWMAEWRAESGVGHSEVEQWAQGLARLDVSAPVSGFGEQRWRDLIDAGRDFLEAWGDAAARLGWSAADCFGAHPIAPAARYDCAGLVLFLHDGAVVETISVDTATIRHRDGTRLSYRRRASRAGVMLLWELRP